MIHLYVERKDPDLAGARILETTKNRFGSSGCKQIMAITDSGFKMIGQTM